MVVTCGQVNGDVVYEVRLPMHYNDISTLTQQQAMSLAHEHSDFEAVIGNKPVLGHQLIVDIQSLSVDLHLTVDAGDKKKKKRAVDKRRKVDRVASS